MASTTTGRRHKSEGGIRQRDASGRLWQITYTLHSGSGVARKRCYETVRGTYADAAKRLREVLGEVGKGTYIKPTKQLTGEFLTQWLETYAVPNVSPRTVYGWERIVASQLAPTVGDIPLADVRPTDVLAMHKSLYARSLSALTVLHAHRLLSQALSHAVKWGLIAVNPCAGVDAPRPRKRTMQSLDWDTAQTFFTAIEGSRFRNVYFADFYLGLRRSELLALRWPQVDLVGTPYTLTVVAGLHRLKGRGLVLLDTKTASSRRPVDLQSEVVDLFRQMRVQQIERALGLGVPFNEQGFVFCLADGRPLSPEGVSREFARLRTEAGLTGLRFHDLRHTMASLMLANGTPMEVVQARLGHSSITTTMDQYRHILPGEQSDHAERMAERLRQAK